MKIVRVEHVISIGPFARSREWRDLRRSVYKAVKAVDWPTGTGRFKIYPESGKKRGQGNGVLPIKHGLMVQLSAQNWRLEVPLNIATVDRPGNLDAVFQTKYGIVALEWETGNISSSHRALNKMMLGLLKGVLIAGILVVPSRELYKYLTDRIGNIAELEPYLDLWRSVPCKNGLLDIIVVEHDATSRRVPRIPKMTSGRAKA